jgi:DNA polymerase I-like protein with 3'-5' exonuclease and polymerase domains
MKGLFYEEEVRTKGGPVRERPKVPKTGWKPPKEFPNLSACKVLAVDTETYDPELLTHGPGWARHSGNIVGVSIAADANNAWYFPIAHTEEAKHNLPKDKVLHFLRDVLEKPGVQKIGANITYDIGWLMEEGVFIKGPFLDIQHAEALIDENRLTYNLDVIARQYLKTGKIDSKLYKWAARYYGGAIDQTQRANIYRCPPKLVGPYAEGDVTLPFQIWEKQKRLIAKDNLEKVFDLECRLIPLMVDMRFRGVRVDIAAAERARDELLILEKEQLAQIKRISGVDVNINASASIAKAFDKLGLPYPRTEKGAPSFVKTFLEHHTHPLPKLITDARQTIKARTTFIENYILAKNVNGRLYCEFPQLKGDDGGTVSGRFSSRNPNLQNNPARVEKVKQLVRACFVCDEEYDCLGAADSSQIEYRFLAHHAKGEGAKGLRKMYRKDHTTDFHAAIIVKIKEITNLVLERKPAKTINFGLVYGMGKDKLRESLGLTEKKANELMTGYHIGVPFVKNTFKYYADLAQEQGFVETILGRRSRFTLFSPEYSYEEKALPFDQAMRAYGPGLQRAFTHKALNRVLQGGAADYMKTLMLRAYEEGVFEELGGPPHLTVHDELVFSFNFDKGAALKELLHIMNTAIKLKVPVMTDLKVGKDWANMIPYANEKRITY